MSLRPKTVKRLALLGAVSGLGIATVGSLYVLRQHREERALYQAREAGIEAFARGQHAEAIQLLKPWIAQHPDDANALYAQAASRYAVELPAGAHIAEARRMLLQVLAGKPDHIESRRLLMEIYLQSGFNAELLEQADYLRNLDPTDEQAARYRAIALSRQARSTDALEAWREVVRLTPDDLTAQIETLIAMRRAALPGNELIAWAEARVSERPDDVRRRIPLAFAARAAGHPDRALQILDDVASHDLDSEAVNLVVEQFDRLAQTDRAEALLDRAARQYPAELLTSLIERLWQKGRFIETAERIASLPDEKRNTPRMIGLRATSLLYADRRQDARPLIDSLRSSVDQDRIARAWTLALDARLQSELNPAERLNKLRSAVEASPDEALFHLWLGSARLALGELDLALLSWRTAADRMPAWALPHVEASRALQQAGRIDEALASADQALRRAPTLPGVRIQRTRIAVEVVRRSGDPEQARSLLEFVAQLSDAAPDHIELRLIRAELLARALSPKEALATLDQLPATSAPLSGEAAENLRQITLLEPDLAKRAAERLRAATGTLQLAPDAALPLALTTGSADAAIQSLSPAFSTSTPKALRHLYEARILSHFDHPRARDLWTELAQTHSNDPNLVPAIVREGLTHITDREVARKAIESLRSMGGDEGLLWRVGRMRWLLASGDLAQAREAATIGAEIVRLAPADLDARLLIAQALDRCNNRAYAIQHLREALRIDATALPAARELVRLLLLSGNPAEARTVLTRLASVDHPDAESTYRVAMLLLEHDLTTPALDLLTRARRMLKLREPGLLLLAELRERLNQLDEARSIYEQLISRSEPSPNSLAAAASFYHRIGDPNTASTLLSRIDRDGLSPLASALASAAYYTRTADLPAARAAWKRAAELAPNDPELARARVRFELESADYARAMSLADTLLVQFESDTTLISLRAKAELLMSPLDNEQKLEKLIEALSTDPESAPRLRALRALLDASRNGKPTEELADSLGELARAHPDALPLQERAIEASLAVGQRKQAADLARRLAEHLPSHAPAIRLAATTLLRAGEPAAARSLSARWRSLDPADTLGADLLEAEAALITFDPKSAVTLLNPHSATLLRELESRPDRVWTLLRAQTLAGDPKPTILQLNQHLTTSMAARRLAIDAARWSNDLDAASDILNDVINSTPPSEQATREQIVSALLGLSQRFDSASPASRAIDLADQLAKADPSSAMASLMLGEALRLSNEHARAEVALREAVRLDPNQSTSLNALAWFLHSTDRDRDEARRLIERAIELDPQTPSLQDTAGWIALKQNRPVDAERHFRRALQGDSEHLDALIGLARTQQARGEAASARVTLGRIDTILASERRPTPARLRSDVRQLRDELSGVQ